MQSLLFLRLAAFAAFCLAYFFSFYLPIWVSYENGPIEIIQSMVLLVGGVQALYLAIRSQSKWRYLWLAVAPIWFICLGRELSWGAVFLAPIGFTATGPTYTSQILPYKPLVAPIVGLMLAMSLGIVVRFRLWSIGTVLAKARHLPVIEIFLVVVAALLMTAAENHMGMSLDGYVGHAQIFEEMVELAAYLLLLAAQQRVRIASRLFR